MQAWAEAEAGAARAAGRRVRFSVRHLDSPPLTLAWTNSHQEVKFPGEAPVPNTFVVGVNVDADGVATPAKEGPDGASLQPDSDLAEGIRWLPGLPRFWLFHRRRAPPDTPSRAIL